VLKSSGAGRAGSPQPEGSTVAQRVSRLDTGSRAAESDVKRRGVSPTPLGNLRPTPATPQHGGENSGRDNLTTARRVVHSRSDEENSYRNINVQAVAFPAATYTDWIGHH
jgi:hypothetical protein